MARRKRPAQLQQQLTYATARAAHITPPKTPGTKPSPRPKEDITYKSYTEKIGADNALYTVVASKNAIAFFGDLAALGLTAFDASKARVPRYFKPAKIHATIGTTDVSYVTAAASGRSYPKYTAKPSSGTQTSHTAPISAVDYPTLIALAKGVITAKQGSVGGGHGRIWFTPEYSLIADNGNAV